MKAIFTIYSYPVSVGVEERLNFKFQQIIGLLTTLRTLNSYIIQTINRKMTSNCSSECNSPESNSSSRDSSEYGSSELNSTSDTSGGNGSS